MSVPVSRRAVIGLGVAAALLPHIDGTLAAVGKITGKVVYRERMLLPPDAVLTVQLEDVAKMDAAAVVLASAEFPARSSPTDFSLDYDPAKLEAGHPYALRAAIRAGEELLFTTTEHIAFDPANAEGLELPVVRVGEMPIVGAWLAEDIFGGGVIDNLQTTLVIGPDGAVHGMGGCNRYFGSAKIDGEIISFNDLGTTQMACPPAVMDQELKFHQALARTFAFRTDAATRKLYLIDGEGQVLVSFSSM